MFILHTHICIQYIKKAGVLKDSVSHTVPTLIWYYQVSEEMDYCPLDNAVMDETETGSG